ncbi:hypothetical protein HMPREF1574_00201 [Gardnerella pickettii JCP7659]|uniref:Uncharacterized protein n=1 Tax=Gardnerella pickettii JCP8017A TaxID=1261062 RepID=T2PJK9_9BIFI|nr:hypothetical protein HMPREF1577_01096 [Gardnerella pickettii JCP8017A]EPI55958.1 hypothetical protein HMPREF1574_00201 [Gardnerella pickettii JCP7659]EPI60003.1 hypothetical protein HMPREF1578_01259 [Gardnerella pickettii JCP8017B]
MFYKNFSYIKAKSNSQKPISCKALRTCFGVNCKGRLHKANLGKY